MYFRKKAKYLLNHSSEQIKNRLKAEINRNKIVVPYSPVSLIMDVTTACNMKCPHCSTQVYRKESSSQHLLLSKGKELLDKFSKATFVGFCGAGEPTLNPDLFDLAKYAKRLKMKVFVTSNGTLLHKRTEELLTSHIDILEISIKGAWSEDYANVSGRNEDEFYSIIRSVNKLSKCRNRPWLFMSYVLDRKKICDISHVVEVANRAKVDELIFYNLIPDKILKNESDCLFEDDKKWVMKILNRNFKKSGRMAIKGPGFYSRDSVQRKCSNPFQFLRLGPDGGVSGCTRAISTSLINGNAFAHHDVYNTNHFIELRNEHINTDIPLRYECLYCGVRSKRGM